MSRAFLSSIKVLSNIQSRLLLSKSEEATNPSNLLVLLEETLQFATLLYSQEPVSFPTLQFNKNRDYY